MTVTLGEDSSEQEAEVNPSQEGDVPNGAQDTSPAAEEAPQASQRDNVIIVDYVEHLNAVAGNSSNCGASAALGDSDARRSSVEDLITTAELRSVWGQAQLPRPQLREKRIIQAQEALRQNQFVIIRSSCRSLAMEIALCLQRQLNREARACSVTIYGEANFEDAFDLFTLTDGLERHSRSVQFVDLATLSPLAFRKVVGQIELQARNQRARGMAERLRERDQWVVFYIHNDDKPGASNVPLESMISLSVSEELEVLINLWNDAEHRTEEPSVSDIYQQFHGAASHLWGASEAERLQRLETAIKEGTLAQEFQRIQAQSETWETVEKAKYRILLDQLIGTSNYGLTDGVELEPPNAFQLVARHMLVILTQLEDLNASDFHELAHQLCRGRTGESIKSIVPDEAIIRYAEDGKTPIEEKRLKTAPQKESVHLTEILGQFQDQILSRIGIRKKDGKLTFKTEGHALVARECAEESLAVFSENLIVQAISKSPLLFQVSSSVAVQLCKIFSEHLYEFTRDERARKLYDFYFQFLFFSETSKNTNQENDFLRAIHNAFRMAAGQDSQAARLRADFYQRFGALLEAICSLERSGKTVHAFIEQVLYRNRGRNAELAHDVILQIVRNLRHVSFVDSMHWLKIVLSSGRQTHWEQGCREIATRIALETSLETQSDEASLHQLAAWLPRTTTTVTSYNNHSAALFVPRLVCLRALERLKRGSFGEIDVVPPFFDLANESGLFQNAEVAVDLMCRPVTSYQMEELDFRTTQDLLHARWELRGGDGKFDIRILEPNLDSYADHPEKLRLFMVLIVLIEAINAFVLEPQPRAEKRWDAVKRLVQAFASSLPEADRHTAADLADRFDRNLCEHDRQLHHRHIEIARYLSSMFYEVQVEGLLKPEDGSVEDCYGS